MLLLEERVRRSSSRATVSSTELPGRLFLADNRLRPWTPPPRGPMNHLRRECSFSAPPVTWAAGWFRAWSRPATRCECWYETASGCPHWPGVQRSRLSSATPGPADIAHAMENVDVVYYLIHSMVSGKGFAQVDRRIAQVVATASAAAAVGRIVYLGGLHPADAELSPHLRSRVEVGEIFLESGVPTLVLQAGVVIGSGSASFEMVRHLTDVLPYMPAPRWVRNRIQPIAVRDVLHYLLGPRGSRPTSTAPSTSAARTCCDTGR